MRARRTRGIGRVVLLASLTLLAGSAVAEETGFYFGMGAGASKHDVSDGSADPQILVGFGGIFGGGIFTVPRTTLDTDTEDTGWRGLVGYRIHRYVAAELEYLDFGTSKISETYDFALPFGGPTSLERNYSTDVTGPAVSLLGILPVGAQFELFARAGLLFADSKVRAEQRIPQAVTYADEVTFAGLGVDWNFTPRWSVRLEYQRSKDIEANLDLAGAHVELMSLDVLYRL